MFHFNSNLYPLSLLSTCTPPVVSWLDCTYLGEKNWKYKQVVLVKTKNDNVIDLGGLLAI